MSTERSAISKKGRESLPPPQSWYSAFGASVSHSLTAQIHERGILPPPPNTLSSVIGTIHDNVHLAWDSEMCSRMEGRDFSAHVGNATKRELRHLKETSAFPLLLKEDNYEVFQRLRWSGEPSSWNAIVSALSAREQLNAQLLRTHIEQMENSEVIASFGYSKAEMFLFADLSRDLQKPIDQAYIRQMDIKQDNVPSFQGKKGAEYFYISQKGKKANTVIEPFISKLPHEIDSIVTVLESYATRVENETKAGTLDTKTYSAFPNYLRTMIRLFRSTDTALEATYNGWSDLRTECARLAVEDKCPIVINPINFNGEGGHIDIELLVGIADNTNTELIHQAKLMSDQTNAFALGNGADPNKLPAVPILFLRSISSNGTNLSVSSTANSLPEYIAYNLSGGQDKANHVLEAYGTRVFASAPEVSSYLKTREISTIAHELGHLFLLNMGHGHLGDGLSQNKLEELKADTLGALYFSKSNERSEEECRHFLEVYLIDYIESIRTTIDDNTPGNDADSSLWYGFSGLTIIRTLFENNSIAIKDGKINIIDAKTGIDAMAAFGRDIIGKYTDESITASDIETYVGEIEKQNKLNENVNKYIDLIRD